MARPKNKPPINATRRNCGTQPRTAYGSRLCRARLLTRKWRGSQRPKRRLATPGRERRAPPQSKFSPQPRAYPERQIPLEPARAPRALGPSSNASGPPAEAPMNAPAAQRRPMAPNRKSISTGRRGRARRQKGDLPATRGSLLVPLHRGFDGLKFNGGLGGPPSRPEARCCARRPGSA